MKQETDKTESAQALNRGGGRTRHPSAHDSIGAPRDDRYRLISTACVVTQYLASMFAFSHFGRVAGSFR